MPWKPGGSLRHNSRLKGKPKKQRQWSAVANNVLKRTGDEGRAVRSANAVVKKRGRKRRQGRY
jgi:hypothetical protein